jgi:hypothetical protein
LPVIATQFDNLVQVRFRAPQQIENQHVRADVVCYLRIANGSLEINYSHHIIHARDGSTGPFSAQSPVRMALDANLQAAITLGVAQEFWASLNPQIKTIPGTHGTPLSEVQW